jgi:3-oxoacyl-[acyl-carrier protein] reductase
MMDLDLSGRVALVTGASGELGRAIAQSLAEAGAAVALHYFRGEQRARSLEEKLTRLGLRTAVVSADVTVYSSVVAMSDQLCQSLGRPDIVVANSVVQYEWMPILEQPLEDFDTQYQSSVRHLVHLAKVFAPSMLKKGWGRFVAINTECAMQCGRTQGAYASAKRGMDGIVRVLARELGGGGVTVNQVAPGWTVSDRDREAGTERQPAYEAELPLGRRTEDRDVANAVVFLASERARAITGAYLPVCSGNVMPGI